MPKITYLKEFEGKLWARLELDGPTTETFHILSDSEIQKLKDDERKDAWDEIKYSTRQRDE